MKPIIIVTFLLFYIFMFLNFPVWSEKSYVALHSIDYPKVITIPKNFKKDMNVSFKIHYIYLGKSIVPDGDSPRSYYYSLNYTQLGKTFYLTKDGRTLPGARKHFNNDRMLPTGKGGGGDNFVEPMLVKGEKDNIEIKVLSPWIFEHTDLDESIEEKSLSSIRISIGLVNVEWIYVVCDKDGKERIQEGEFYINVNKTIEIKVKYEGEKGEK